MILALEQELVLQRQYLENYKIETIYFGGGTPSLLHENELSNILETVYKNYSVVQDAEITLEANPDDLDLQKLYSIKKLGINRLSIGIQSFSNEVLKFLNRIHEGKDAYNSVINARKAGFDNISIDLIYGINKNGHSGWNKDLKIIEELMPEHISAYCLTIEQKTTFGSWLKKGYLKPIDDEYAAQQFEHLLNFLQLKGYEQYEISNFCRLGKYSKHNTNYWRQEKYLGIGPGAHSYNGASRQFNVSHNMKYMQSIEKGIIPYELDFLSDTDKINEYIMTSLRTRWGCDLKKINIEFSGDLYLKNRTYINDLVEKGFVHLENQVMFLTAKGKLLADKIASDLFV